MSKLSTLINNARAGLSIQQSIPGARWDAIAKQCGTEEIEEQQKALHLVLENAHSYERKILAL